MTESKKCCGRCEWYLPETKNLGATGRCIQGVPQVITAEYTPKAMLDGSVVLVASKFNSAHPLVLAGHYCGQFKPKTGNLIGTGDVKPEPAATIEGTPAVN